MPDKQKRVMKAKASPLALGILQKLLEYRYL